MTTSPEWTDNPDLVDFYTKQRSQPEDLYPSERRFIPWLAQTTDSVLDTGCAAGGFSNIWRHFNPSMEYTGIDIAPSLIEAARKLHPGQRFEVGNVTDGVDFPNEFAAVVQALGWLTWETQWVKAVEELWRLTGKYLLIDVRIATDEESAISTVQQMALANPWDGKTTTPYVVVAWPEFAGMLLSLAPASVLGFGYWGKAADTVVGVTGDICLAVFVIEKNPAHGGDVSICMDMPLSWPSHLANSANVLPAKSLDDLMVQ